MQELRWQRGALLQKFQKTELQVGESNCEGFRKHYVPMPPKRRRASPAAEAAPPSTDFGQLTVAELKTLLANAGVACDKFKKKSEYIAAAEALAQPNTDPSAPVMISSSDDDKSAQAASKLVKPSVVIISSSDDEEPTQSAQLLSVARGSGRAFGGSAASVTPVSQPKPTVAVRGALMFDPIFDANGVQIDVDEDYRESNDVLYGKLNIKTVGIQHYRGVIHVQETVFLIREPRNPYDSNAIRVDNLSRAQIGHIAAKDGKKTCCLML